MRGRQLEGGRGERIFTGRRWAGRAAAWPEPSLFPPPPHPSRPRCAHWRPSDASQSEKQKRHEDQKARQERKRKEASGLQRRRSLFILDATFLIRTLFSNPCWRSCRSLTFSGYDPKLCISCLGLIVSVDTRAALLYTCRGGSKDSTGSEAARARAAKAPSAAICTARWH
jgi:hypothetical protein